jgi:hypothetical protein
MTDDTARGEEQVRADLRALAEIVARGQDGGLIAVVTVAQPGERCDWDAGNPDHPDSKCHASAVVAVITLDEYGTLRHTLCEAHESRAGQIVTAIAVQERKQH